MKTKLKENGGFAIVSVIFLLVVLSAMATVMFIYSVTSLQSVRFMSDRKKAEYLAQAGVESASYAFQLAVKSNNDDATKLIVDTSDDGKIINSNKVYMIYSGGAYQYVDEATAQSHPDNEIIGYYEVEIESKPFNFVQKAIKNEKISSDLSSGAENTFTQYLVELSESQRVFTATGHAYGNDNAVAKKKAYISEPAQGLGRYYDAETGIIDASLSGTNKTLTIRKRKPFP